MAFKFGFYNAIDHDRRYDALDVSRLFDGIIADGIIANYEKGFQVLKTNNNAMEVKVSSGRAWFNHTWSYNDADLIMELDPSDNVKNRKDAIVLEINSEARTNSLKIIKGESVNGIPSYPNLIRTNVINQYALAYVTVNRGTTSIAATSIEDARGKTINNYLTPFSHGIMTQLDSSSIFANWQQALDEILLNQQAQFDSNLAEDEIEFREWFDNLHYILDGDVAGHLQNEIDELFLRNPFSLVDNEYDIEQRGNYIQIQTSQTADNSLTRTIAYLYPGTTYKLYGLLSFGKAPDSINEHGYGHQIAIVPLNPDIDEDLILYRGYHREPSSTAIHYSWGEWKTLSNKNHASSDGRYGLSTSGQYGHVKTISSLNWSGVDPAVALHAAEGKTLNDKITSANRNIESINNNLRPFEFTNGALLDKIVNNPTRTTFFKTGNTAISDFPFLFKVNTPAAITVVRDSSNYNIMVYWTGLTNDKPLFKRAIKNKNWDGEWVYIGGEPVKIWDNNGHTGEFTPIHMSLQNKDKEFTKLLVIFKMGNDLHNYIPLEIPRNTSIQYRPFMMNSPNLFMYRITWYTKSYGMIHFDNGYAVHPHSDSGEVNNNYMIPWIIYGM